jgi:hypothetical protein
MTLMFSEIPNQQPATDAPSPGPVAEARAEIGRLTADKAFAARYASGDANAASRMEALHKAAYPDSPGEEARPTEQAASSDKPPALPLKIDENASGQAVVEMHATANAVVENLGLPHEVAHGGIEMIESSIAARAGQPMTDIEQATLDFRLHEMWGDDYSASMDRVHAAFVKLHNANPEGAEWLQRALLHAGPQTAAWAFATLANMDRPS